MIFLLNRCRSLAEACSDGDVPTVRKLLHEGGSVHETTEEGESLLSLACSAGYYELAQVFLIFCSWSYMNQMVSKKLFIAAFLF